MIQINLRDYEACAINIMLPITKMLNYNNMAVNTNCASCSLREICLPVGLDEREIAMLDNLVNHKCKIQRGGYLYRTGLRFQSLYAIRRGFFKTYVLEKDGRQQVTGFYMTGELLGLDAICTEIHSCDAIALEDSEVCEVPFTKLEEMSRGIPMLMNQFHKIMSREIVKDHGVMMLLGSMKAEERLATFLLNLSRRFFKRGYSSTNFILRMTREEIGSYLGLKFETVSRAFSRLQDENIISVSNKHININDMERLKSKIGDP